MALKDQIIELTLRARNLLSSGTDAAAKSVEELAGSAEGLKGKLRSLEDQAGLVRQFQSASKAVDKTATAYDRARLRADKLADKIGESGVVTKRQAQEFDAARKAVDKAEKEYKGAEQTLGELGDEAQAAGVDISDLNKEQRRLAEESKKAKRALSDVNSEVSKGDSRFLSFRRNLSKGVVTFGKWAAAASAAGAALAIGGLTRFTASQADLARQTLASADAFGISADALQKWQYSANEVGIGGEKVADIMKDVAEKIGDAYLTGGGEAREVIQGLGLDLDKLAQMKPDEQILAIAKELDGMPKPGQIQILEALASDASLLLPLLGDNAAKLRELSDEAESRGAIFSDDELKTLSEVNSEFRKITTSVSGFVKEIVIKAAPAFKRLGETINKSLKDKPELVDNIAKAFSGLVEVVAKFAEKFSKDTSELSNDVGKLGNVVDGMRNLFVAAFRGVQAFGAGSAEVVARLVYDWNRASLAILEFRNKIGLASDEAVEKAKYAVDNAAQSVADLKKQSEDYQTQMIAAGNAAATAFGKARDGAAGVAGKVAEATTATAALGDAGAEAGTKLDESATKAEKFAAASAALALELASAENALEAAGEALLDNNTPEARAEYEKLRGEVERLTTATKELKAAQSLEGINGADEVSVGSQIAEDYRQAAEGMDSAGKSAESAKTKVKELGDEAGAGGEKVKEVGKQATEAAKSIGTGFGAIFAGVIQYVERLSSKAGNLFREMLGGRQTDVGSALEQRLERVTALLDYTRNRVTNGGVSDTLNKWADAAYTVEQRFLEQAVAVERLTDKILDGDRSSRFLNKSAEEVARSFDLLDENQLRPLIGAIQSAQREVEGLNNSLLDTIRSTQQELAALAGDTAEVERLRYQERQFELQQQLNTARALGDKETVANAEKALELTEKAYNERQKQAKAQAAEAKARSLEYEQRQADTRIRDEREERQDISRVEQRTQTQVTQLDRAISSNRTVTLNFAAGGSSFGGITGVDSSDVDRIIDALEAAGYLTTG